MSDGTIPTIVAGLRHGFQQGLTRPEAWRVAQLRGLRRLLTEHAADFEAALASTSASPAPRRSSPRSVSSWARSITCSDSSQSG